MICHFILYVRDQETSTRFYEKILNLKPSLNVPGMTEFRFSEGCVLGLMPEKGIKRLLGDSISDPEKTNGIARAEVYFVVPNPEEFLNRAKDLEAKILSPLEARNWGHLVGYIADPDGHVIAFSRAI